MRILGVLYVGVLVVHVLLVLSNSPNSDSRVPTLQTTRARGVSCRSLSREWEP